MQINNFSKTFQDIKIAKGVFFEDDRGSLKRQSMEIILIL